MSRKCICWYYGDKMGHARYCPMSKEFVFSKTSFEPDSRKTDKEELEQRNAANTLRRVTTTEKNSSSEAG